MKTAAVVHLAGIRMAAALVCALGLAGAADQAEIRAEVARMAADFVQQRPLQGFDHPDMSLQQAYAWQDELVRQLEPWMGGVVGYKTGGHDPGPGFPTFPPEGIRGQILAGMLRRDGDHIRVTDTRVGFLEADFAVRVGDRRINSAVTDLELLAGLDAIVPFAEVPDPYYDPAARSVHGTIVANMTTRYSFTGTPVPIQPTSVWLERIRSVEFAVLDEDDRVVAAGNMRNWYDPIAVIRWLRDQLRASGKTLEPGQILSLGNIGIIRQLHAGSPRGPAYPGDRFRLEYRGLADQGPASVTINIDRSSP